MTHAVPRRRLRMGMTRAEADRRRNIVVPVPPGVYYEALFTDGTTIGFDNPVAIKQQDGLIVVTMP